jgi:hypothetical protein
MKEKFVKSCHIINRFVLTNLFIPIAAIMFCVELYHIWKKE